MRGRILVVFWSGGGGGSQYAANLARRLTLQFGASKVKLSLAQGDPTIESAVARGVDVRVARVAVGRKTPLRSLTGLPEAASELARHAADCDLVIGAMNFAMLAPLSLTLRKRFVYFAHDPSPHPGDYAAWAQRATQAVLLRRAEAVVALSDFAAERLRSQEQVARKLHVVPLSAVFEPKPTAPCRESPVRFLFAGRMLRYKGAELLAEGLAPLRSRDDWRLDIVGAGPAMSTELRRRLGFPQIDSLRTCVATEDEMHSHYLNCDVLLAPYVSATQSGVVADALAYGKACLVTPVGALPEQIAHGAAGWIARSATGDAITEAINSVLQTATTRRTKSEGARSLSMRCWNHNYWDWIASLVQRGGER